MTIAYIKYKDDTTEIISNIYDMETQFGNLFRIKQENGDINYISAANVKTVKVVSTEK